MENKDIIKRSRISLYLTALGFIIVFGASTYNFFYQEELEEEVKKMEKEYVKMKDTVNTYERKFDSLNTLTSRNSKLISVVADYYRYRNFKQLDSIMSTLADSLDRFYLMTNVSKAEVRKDFENYWRNNPKSRYFIEIDNIKISELKSSGYQVELITDYTKNEDSINKVISVFKINRENKIYFARDKFIIDL